MKLGYRSFSGVYRFCADKASIKDDSASCLVRNCLGVPLDMRADIREICAVYTPESHRGNGFAAGLLTGICCEADNYNKTLLLTIDEPERERLTKFYAKFGFAVIDDSQYFMMIRNPHAAEVALNV
jgi:predicted GNAT family N-acyltransferase